MRFKWDENKSKRNLLKHDLRFETAVLVFDDPFAISQRDLAIEEEERWVTIGQIGPGAMIAVVHTMFEKDGEEVIRIISARAADAREKRAYAEAYKGTETRHRRDRRQKRRRH